MNHALELWNVRRSMMDFYTCVLRLIASLDELLIKWSSSVNKRFSFFVKNCDSSILGKTFLFPFWESTVSLVNCALLSLSQLLVFRDLIFKVIIFSFYWLVHTNCWLDVVLKISNVYIFLWNFNSNSLCLFLNLNWFLWSVSILAFEDLKLILKTSNNIILTSKLCFIITLESSNANI